MFLNAPCGETLKNAIIKMKGREEEDKASIRKKSGTPVVCGSEAKNVTAPNNVSYSPRNTRKRDKRNQKNRF
jgi:hypothetical protein